MLARLLTLAAVLSLVGAVVSVEEANAYRGSPNPVSVELNWPSAYGKLRASADFFACELAGPPQTCTTAQRTKIGTARRAVSTMPYLRALGTIAMYTTAFEVGWSIGRTIDTKWLHLSGTMPTTDAVWTVGTWVFGTATNPDGWGYMIGAPSYGWSQRIEVPWPNDVTKCTAAGSGDMSTAANCGSQWALWAGYQQQQLDKLQAGAFKTRGDLGLSTPFNCGAGSVGLCRQIFLSETAMEAQIGANGQMLASNPVPARSAVSTNISAPDATPPSWAGAPAIAAVAAMLEDEPEAIAGAGTSVETDTGAYETGVSVDPTWEGYDLPEIEVPNCTGLTVVECSSALDALGHTGTITELELDIASADLTEPAGAVVTTSPGASTSISVDTEVTLNVNPDPLPFVLPSPLAAETYADYLVRLQALGYVGTVTLTTLTEAAGVPELGPEAPVTVKIPTIGTVPGRTIVLPGGWPTEESTPRLELDTPIEISRNPTTYPPVDPTTVPPVSGGGVIAPPALDFSPITDLDFGCAFPFGFICYAIDVTEWFNVTPDAPVFSFDLPDVSVLGETYTTDGQYVVDLNIMDEYMSILRTLMSIALWIGTVYFLATRLLGFNSGDPGEAVDEGLDWSR